MLNKQKGFTLVELIVVLSIASVIAFYTMQHKSKSVAERFIDSTIAEISILISAQTHYYEENGSWATDVATLVSSGQLDSFNNRNLDGNAYTFTPSGPNTIRLVSEYVSSDTAIQIAGRFPQVNLTNSNRTIGIPIVRPGYEPSHNELVHRDGSRDVYGGLNMRTAADPLNPISNIEMGRNRINNASRISGDNIIAETPGGTGSMQTNVMSADFVSSSNFEYR